MKIMEPRVAKIKEMLKKNKDSISGRDIIKGQTTLQEVENNADLLL